MDTVIEHIEGKNNGLIAVLHLKIKNVSSVMIIIHAI